MVGSERRFWLRWGLISFTLCGWIYYLNCWLHVPGERYFLLTFLLWQHLKNTACFSLSRECSGYYLKTYPSWQGHSDGLKLSSQPECRARTEKQCNFLKTCKPLSWLWNSFSFLLLQNLSQGLSFSVQLTTYLRESADSDLTLIVKMQVLQSSL